jgi:cytochrome c-type biogenesis protein CcmH/NrfF
VSSRARIAALAVLLVVASVAVATSTAVAVAAAPRAFFPDIEDEVMCPVCGTPLNLAPQDAAFANRERAFIRARIARGDTKAQIKRRLADEYGPSVLADPRAQGFDLAAYLVPILAALAALAALAFAFPRWRRRARAAATEPRVSARSPSAAEARRLDEELARYDA